MIPEPTAEVVLPTGLVVRVPVGADLERRPDAPARIRALCAVERDAEDNHLAGDDLAAYRRQHAGPVLAVRPHRPPSELLTTGRTGG